MDCYWFLSISIFFKIWSYKTYKTTTTPHYTTTPQHTTPPHHLAGLGDPKLGHLVYLWSGAGWRWSYTFMNSLFSLFKKLKKDICILLRVFISFQIKWHVLKDTYIKKKTYRCIYRYTYTLYIYIYIYIYKIKNIYFYRCV